MQSALLKFETLISGNKILKFDKTLIIIWLFVELIISTSFKGLLRDRIINPPKWWYHSIEEINKAPESKLNRIFVPPNSVTYFVLKKRSISSPEFTKLMNLKEISFELDLDYMIGFIFVRKFFRYNSRSNDRKYNRILSGFLPSIYWETFQVLGGSEVVTDEICYDHVLDVRFIRDHFQF